MRRRTCGHLATIRRGFWKARTMVESNAEREAASEVKLVKPAAFSFARSRDTAAERAVGTVWAILERFQRCWRVACLQHPEWHGHDGRLQPSTGTSHHTVAFNDG